MGFFRRAPDYAIKIARTERQPRRASVLSRDFERREARRIAGPGQQLLEAARRGRGIEGLLDAKPQDLRQTVEEPRRVDQRLGVRRRKRPARASF